MTVRDVFFMGGQSNSGGTNGSGELGADIAAVPLWKDELTITPAPTLGPLSGAAYVSSAIRSSSGCTYTFGRLLLAAGYRPILWNCYRGSTPVNSFIPGGAYYATLVTSLTSALAATVAAYPNDRLRFHMLWDQGEFEARYGYPSPSGPEQAIIDAWATNVQTVCGVFESVVGRLAWLHVIGTDYQLDGQNNPAAFRALQQSAVSTFARPGIFHTRDRSDGISYADIGGLHPDQAGYILHGQRLAPAMASFLNGLGSLSDATRNSCVNQVRNKGNITPAANHYVHLYQNANWTTPLTSGSATGYAPASNTDDATTWPAASGRAKSNGVAFTFPVPGATWPAFRGWRLTDSATEGVGTVLAQGSHEPIVATVATGAWSYPAGGITFVAAVGGFSDAVAHGLLDRIFGGAALSPSVTQYGSYFAGDPQGGGAQAGSRVAITQASTWGNSAGGVSVTVAPISLAQQVTGTYWAEHAASSGGSPLLSAERPTTVGAAGTIAAGQLKTQVL